jgi:hypothetical protein
MKQQLSWTLCLQCNGVYQQLKKAVLVVIEHHFNCGDWCMATEGTAVEVGTNTLQFRCKAWHKQLYPFMKNKHEKEFMEDTKLQQLSHQDDTNRVEGFNKFLTKFLPKDRAYCQTIENQAREMFCCRPPAAVDWLQAGVQMFLCLPAE